MLVITREPGQSITLEWCGEKIGTIDVSQIQGNKVRLAFDMEHHVRIMRSELLDREKSPGGYEAAEAATAVYVPLDPAGLY